MSVNLQSYLELQRALQGVGNADQPVSEEQYSHINTLIEQWPGQVSLHTHLFAVFCRQSKPASKAEIDKKIQAIDKCMLLSQNSTSLQMWTEYADFVSSLETTGEWTQNEKDVRLKAVLDRAIECVGHTRLDSSRIWTKYINFETTRNNMALVNLLCYMALQTPFNGDDSKDLLNTYENILNSLFEKIFQEITQAEGQESASQIPERYKSQQAELVKRITGEYKGEKEAFIEHLKSTVLPQAEAKARTREPFEQSLQGAPTMKDWQAYIAFEESQGELKRVTQLYERAMGSTLELQNDFSLWMKYADFIQDKLKDVSLMRAKFEQKLSNSKLLATKDKVEILLEHAQFEEMQTSIPRARRILEQLDLEIAPGLVKAAIARINFEKRQGQVNRARELYHTAFTSALQRDDSLAVTYIACQYARFLAHKCNDVQRAHEVFSQAISNPNCSNKVLYLSYINLAKGLNTQAQTQTPKQIFERALQQLEDYQKADDQEKFEDLQDICHYYLAYLEEESEGAGANVNNLKEIKATKARMEEKGFLAPKFNSKSILARVGGPQEPPAEPQKLGGIGRKRQNTESIQQLESQIS